MEAKRGEAASLPLPRPIYLVYVKKGVLVVKRSAAKPLRFTTNTFFLYGEDLSVKLQVFGESAAAPPRCASPNTNFTSRSTRIRKERSWSEAAPPRFAPAPSFFTDTGNLILCVNEAFLGGEAELRSSRPRTFVHKRKAPTTTGSQCPTST